MKMIYLSNNFDLHYNFVLSGLFLFYNITLTIILMIYHQNIFTDMNLNKYSLLISFILWTFLEIINRLILLILIIKKINNRQLSYLYLDYIKFAHHFTNKEHQYYWIQFNINIIFIIGITIWISILHNLYTHNFLLWILILTKLLIYIISFIISKIIQICLEKYQNKNNFNLLPIRYSSNSLSYNNL